MRTGDASSAAAPAEASLEQVAAVEAAAPEETVPETAAPEEAVPEEGLLGASAPEEAVLEASAPEQAVPEAGDGRRKRLSAEDRRKQLVGIGLQMLRSQPIHDLSIDAVAAEAGISRGLLFHYFPTKRDFYIAVVSAAGRRLLRVTMPDPSLPADEQLRQMLLSFVAFVTRRRDSYISFVRGAAGGDVYVVEIYAETRAALTTRVLELLGVAAAATRPASRDRLTVHAWLAYVEDLAIEWSGLVEVDRPTSADELVDQAIAALHALRSLDPPQSAA